MSKVKDCLRRTISLLERSDILDDDMRAETVGALRRYLDRQDLPDDIAFQKMAFALKDAEREIYIATITKQATRRKQEQLLRAFEGLDDRDFVHALRDYVDPRAGVASRHLPSVEVNVRSLVESSTGRLHAVWSRLFSYWGTDRAFALDFRRAQLGLDASPAAKEAAAQFKEVTSELLQRLRDAGAYTGEIEDFAYRNWHLGKIMGDPEGFSRLMRQHLDPKYHPDPDSTVDRLLYHMQHGDLRDGTQEVIHMARQLRFTSPEGELDLVLRFTADNYAAQTMQGVRMLAKRVALVEAYGPNPTATMNPLFQTAAERARAVRLRGESGAPALEEQAKNARRLLDVQLGHLSRPENQSLANWTGAARDWVSATRLGKVAVAMLGDSVNTVFRSRFHGPGFGGTTLNLIHNLVQVLGDRQARQFAQDLGLWQHAWQMASAARFQHSFASGHEARGFAGRAAALTQRASGAMFFENSLRSAMGRMVLTKMARNLETDFAGLHPRYRLLLENSGIHEAQWRAMQASRVVHETGALDVTAMPREAREVALNFLYREVDTGVVYPSSYDRWLLSGGQRRGTIPGEAIAASTQFFSWPIAMFRKMVMSEWQLGKGGFVAFSSASIASGVLISQLYEVVSGRPAFSWEDPELWKRAVVRSGLLSPVGEMLLGIPSGDAALPVGGPSLEVSAQIASRGWSAGEKFIAGQHEQGFAELLRMARPNLVPNLWWTDALVSEAMDRAMEALDPHYIMERNRRWRREGREL